jgi:hypothetical protein
MAQGEIDWDARLRKYESGHSWAYMDADEGWGTGWYISRNSDGETAVLPDGRINTPGVNFCVPELVNMRNRPAPSPTDPISPDYYKVTLPDGTIVECRAMIRALGLNFALANVLKYLWRAGRKTPDREQDLRKAADYLADEIDHG